MGISNLKPQGGGTNFENYNHSLASLAAFNNSTYSNVVSVTGEGILTSVGLTERSGGSASFSLRVTIDGVALSTIAMDEQSLTMTMLIPFKQSLLVQGIGNGIGAMYAAYGLKK